MSRDSLKQFLDQWNKDIKQFQGPDAPPPRWDYIQGFINKRCWFDEEYKNRFIADPLAELGTTFNITPNKESNLKVIQESKEENLHLYIYLSPFMKRSEDPRKDFYAEFLPWEEDKEKQWHEDCAKTKKQGWIRWEDLHGLIQERCWHDKDFLNRVLNDISSVIDKEIGLPIKEGISIKLHVLDFNEYLIVLSPSPYPEGAFPSDYKPEEDPGASIIKIYHFDQ